MPNEGREFPLADILSVVTGALLSTELDCIYEILKYLTGTSPYTHQLPDVADDCAPALIEQHPGLATSRASWQETREYLDDIDPDIGPTSRSLIIENWLQEEAARLGLTESWQQAKLVVYPLPKEVPTRRDALKDMAEKIGDPNKIVVVMPFTMNPD